MSTDLVWLNATETRVSLAGKGEEMADDNKVTAPMALCLELDGKESVIIEGGRGEIARLLMTSLRQMTREGHHDLTQSVLKARKAAEGDSNDDEIELLQSALHDALALLGRNDLL